MHIRYHNGAVLPGGCAADTFPPGDADAGGLALERSQQKLRALRRLTPQIEAGPVYVRQRAPQEGGGVGQEGHRRRLFLRKALQLRREQVVVGKRAFLRAGLEVCRLLSVKPSIIIVEQLKILRLRLREGAGLAGRHDVEPGLLAAPLVVQKVAEVVPQGAVVDLPDPRLLLRRQVGAQKPGIDHGQQPVLVLAVADEVMFERPGHV